MDFNVNIHHTYSGVHELSGMAVEQNTNLLNQNDGDDEPEVATSLVLEYLEREADYENDRKRSFDNRAGIAIAFLGALLTAFIKIEKFPVLNEHGLQNMASLFLYCFYMVAYIIMVALTVYAIFCFINVFNAKTLARVGENSLYDFRNQNREDVANALCETLRDNITQNCDINEETAKSFRYALKVVRFIMLFACISFFLNLFLVGIGVLA